MIIPSLLLACAWLVPGAHAQAVLSLGGPVSSSALPDEDRLKEWLENEPSIRKKLSSVIARVAGNLKVPSDLRDSVASAPSAAVLNARLAAAGPEERKALLETMPGMKPDPFTGCRTLEGCPQAPMALYADKPDQIEDAVAALMRPWIILQKERGQRLDLSAAKNPRGGLMDFSLEGIPGAIFRVQVSALPSGRFAVRLRGREDPAALYSSERFTALAISQK